MKTLENNLRQHIKNLDSTTRPPELKSVQVIRKYVIDFSKSDNSGERANILERIEAILREQSAQRDELLAEIGMSVTRTRMVAEMDKNQVRRQAKLEILRLVEIDINTTIKAAIAKCEANK